MKIGIITHWFCNENYGQLIQCWAFQQFLLSLGHQPYLIRYRKQRTKKDQFFRMLIHPRKALTSALIFLHKKSDPVHNKLILEGRKFEQFREKNIRKTDTIYHSLQTMEHAADEFDALICGSDNVWWVEGLDDYAKPLFLAFGKSSVKRIAYSASFGEEEINDSFIEFIRPLLHNFDKIAVREQQGVDICKKAGRPDAVHVLDPVFLCPDSAYAKLIESSNIKIPEQPYAFFYFLRADISVPWGKIKEHIKKKQLQNYFVPVYDRNVFPFSEFQDPTIPEWISRIRNAEEVYTNSFHGTCFAIMNHRKFLVFLRKESSLNDRLTSLLLMLGLSSRIYSESESISEQMNDDIDWTEVDKHLCALKKMSVSFLEDALN